MEPEVKGQGMGGQRRWLGLMAGQCRIGAAIIVVALLYFAYLWLSGTIGFCWLSTAVSWVLNADPDKSPYRNSKDLVIFVGTLVTLHFAFRRVKAAEKQNENQIDAIRAQTDQLRLNEVQMELTRRDQLSKRFTEAVKQLGDQDHLAIRMGGIAGLWAVATESTHPEDRIMVLDVLCAFVRSSKKPEEGELREVRPDVEMAMNRLGLVDPYFPWEHEEKKKGPYKRDFSGAYFYNLRFQGRNYSHSIFNDVFLDSVVFDCCILHNSKFNGYSNGNLYFYKCHLNGSSFRYEASIFQMGECDLSGVRVYSKSSLSCSGSWYEPGQMPRLPENVMSPPSPTP